MAPASGTKKTGKKGMKARRAQQVATRNWILGALGVVVAGVLTLGILGVNPFIASNPTPTHLANGKWLRSLSLVTHPGAAGTMPALLPPAKQVKNAPSFLYIGGEYCPYCAASRWAMVIALSRFGRFTHLGTMRSSSTDIYPDTPTWTFYKDNYQSQYLSVKTIEGWTRQGPTSPLEPITEPYLSIFERLDAPPLVPTTQDSGSIPFIVIGGKYVWIGSLYNPKRLEGVGWQTIIQSVKTNQGPMGPAINANANVLTAALCTTDGNRPGSVCDTPTIKGLEAKLKALPIAP